MLLRLNERKYHIFTVMKRHRDEDVAHNVGKKANVDVIASQQRVIETLQSHVHRLERQIESERQLAYQALREQEKAFLEWQRSVEHMYNGDTGSSTRAVYSS